ncbi:hypothetical protein ACQKMD_06740, partial [Viridibacillus sp. NPDC096237]|uniref:hypothetical protein n=1 Tax=Viridibacillus sp. NPDC096237 TaxID=3390721 RepID=UPI003D010BEB
MKWFKNVVARIMGDEVEEYDNEKKINDERIETKDTYEEEYIEHEFETKQQEDHIPAFLRKRDAFRFPLISDAERSQMIQKENPSKQVPPQSNKQVRPKAQPLQQNQWQKQRQKQQQDRFQPATNNQVTSSNRRSPFQGAQQVQEPTLFETREQQRPTSRNRYNEVPKKQERINPFNPTPSYDTTAPYRERPSSSPTRRSIESESQTAATTVPEQVKKQKFKPTNVPSPVYGFHKPPGRSVHNQLANQVSSEINELVDNSVVTQQNSAEIMESLSHPTSIAKAVVETEVNKVQAIVETE